MTTSTTTTTDRPLVDVYLDAACERLSEAADDAEASRTKARDAIADVLARIDRREGVSSFADDAIRAFRLADKTAASLRRIADYVGNEGEPTTEERIDEMRRWHDELVSRVLNNVARDSRGFDTEIDRRVEATMARTIAQAHSRALGVAIRAIKSADLALGGLDHQAEYERALARRRELAAKRDRARKPETVAEIERTIATLDSLIPKLDERRKQAREDAEQTVLRAIGGPVASERAGW